MSRMSSFERATLNTHAATATSLGSMSDQLEKLFHFVKHREEAHATCESHLIHKIHSL
jgi:hypothetical protein